MSEKPSAQLAALASAHTRTSSSHETTMLLPSHHRGTLNFIVALCYGAIVIPASAITPSGASSTPFILPTLTSTSIGTCESRTINYITHNLPQVCLRYVRTDSITLEPVHATATEETTSFPSGNLKSSAESDPAVEEITLADSEADSALDDATFLSFEDWKRQTLEKEGLLDPSTGERHAQVLKDGERRRNPDGIQDALKALEEDVVIDTDFTAFLGERGDDLASKMLHEEDQHTKFTLQDAPEDKGADENRRFRSKDAGKTCKERFNFASLDAGGQIMKTNPEAKSATALLREDRDVYMLNTCHAKNKFLIVELSESILVETVAIANFEFFSSTFREFRVSVSDRYPVKPDRWIDLGTFEAKNSRDMQAFLVEDPRIWARYFRVEFLNHYGNEFYCPVSLLRVHGRTMIQDFLSMDELTRAEDDDGDDPDELSEGKGENLVPEVIADALGDHDGIADSLTEVEVALEELVKTAEAINLSQRENTVDSFQIVEAKRWLENVSIALNITPWIRRESMVEKIFENFLSTDICLPSEAHISLNIPGRSHENLSANGSTPSQKQGNSSNDANASSAPLEPIGFDVKRASEVGKPTMTPIPSPSSPSPSPEHTNNTSLPSEPIVSQNGTAPINSKLLNKTSPTSGSHSPQPTTQESFFKTVTKRLQLLEANSTLSLKYIEDQSKILRSAFTKVEKRQLAKTTSFLENLNDTVLEELRKFGQQYDQIWQSTVIELETQRDQSQRETAAVSTRLSMLAEELVFQKRMSVIQSVLLLLCLGLVIFSRSSVAGFLDVPVSQNMVAGPFNASGLAVESVPSSPATHRLGSSLRGRPRLDPESRRKRSEDSAGSLKSASRDCSPPTPLCTYSRPEEDSKRQNEQHDLLRGARTSLMSGPSIKMDGLPNVACGDPANWKEFNTILEEESYPDFSNSAAWLAPDSASPVASYPRRFEENMPAGDQQTLSHDTHGLGIVRNLDGNVGENIRRTATEKPFLPSSQPARGRPEFSIARKPLPALPQDDQ